MKFNISTALGFFTVLVASVTLFLDMHYSTKEAYHFELKDWHIFAGYFSGVAMVILPEEKLVSLIEKIIHKKLK